MIDPVDFPLNRAVQATAKHVLSLLPGRVSPGLTEADIAHLCVQLLAEEAVTETWYYTVPAFVLVGHRTVLSLSGRDYRPSVFNRVVTGDLVSVDLSPSVDGKWGDCARTFVVGGDATPEVTNGLAAQEYLHAYLISISTPSMTFHALYEIMNQMIIQLGFENLDFAKNLGHTIETTRDDRRYIEHGNQSRLGEVGLFTFEPHIRRPNTLLGFKHENIYFFGNNDILEDL